MRKKYKRTNLNDAVLIISMNLDFLMHFLMLNLYYAFKGFPSTDRSHATSTYDELPIGPQC